MKNLVIATFAAATLATASFAGGKSDAEMEPMVETAEVAPASSSAAGLIVPILAILLLAAAASSNKGGSSDSDDGGKDESPIDVGPF